MKRITEFAGGPPAAVDEAGLADAALTSCITTAQQSPRWDSEAPPVRWLGPKVERAAGPSSASGFSADSRNGTPNAGGTTRSVTFNNGPVDDGGILVLPDAGAITSDMNLWGSELHVRTTQASPLVRYRLSRTSMQLSSVMEIEARARDIDGITWIAMLGWSIAAQLHRDSALRGVGGIPTPDE